MSVNGKLEGDDEEAASDRPIVQTRFPVLDVRQRTRAVTKDKQE
jgi:hypothetical protein